MLPNGERLPGYDITPGTARFRNVQIAPHLLFFYIYNALYYSPLLFVFLLGYEGGGAAEAIALDSQSLSSITFVYIEALGAFTIGSIFTSMCLRRLSGRSASAILAWPQLGIAERVAVGLIALLFLSTQLALIPSGAYQVYAFDSGEMSGGLWSFSTVCTECLILASILVLYSNTKHNVSVFLVLSALNAINLLHGTRIFFIVNVMVGLLYAFQRGKLSVMRILVFGPLAASAIAALTYSVFVSRSSVEAGELSVAKILSPLVYESLFSQLSLRSVVNSPDLMNSTGALPAFLSDVIVFTAPRILIPDKDSSMFLGKYAYMSPLGAFNGYAAGIIYFGVFWPLFYFSLGCAASGLYAKALKSPYWLVFYCYFTGDALFRLMRDGDIIPLKILLDMLGLLAGIVILKTLFNGLARSKSKRRDSPFVSR